MTASHKPLPEMMPRFSVDDLVKWGYLVKMWATREAYPGVPVMTVPQSINELKKQADAVGLKVTVPDHVTGIAVATYSPEVLYIRLPPAAMIKDSENFLMDSRTEYPTPPIYDMYSPTPFKIPKEDKLEFHAARIGDYTLSQCS
jgi:hypothetical protein